MPASALFNNTLVTRFTNEGEDNFVSEYNCIIERAELKVIAGTSLYVLPDYVLNIRRLTWFGYKIYPMMQRDLRESDLIGTEQGGIRPYNYIFNNVGQNTIQIFPVPSQSSPGNLTDFYGSDIIKGCIYEYWRAADHSSKIIPSYFRTPLLNAYSNSKCYLIEGKGQNLKVAKYFRDKYNNLKERYAELITDIQNNPRRTVVGHSNYEPTILYPHLSISKFGIGVEPGE